MNNVNSPAFNPAFNQQTQPVYAFVLDEESAANAGVLPFITETGAYTVQIERAEYSQASTGSHGLYFRVKTGEGLSGSFSLSYARADGSKIFGADFINAMLYLLGIPGFTWANAVNEKGQPIQVAAELSGQLIGGVLESVKNQNDDGRHMELRQVFEPVSGCTASEAKRGEKPEAVAKMLQRLGC